jgi:hypothetical protein
MKGGHHRWREETRASRSNGATSLAFSGESMCLAWTPPAGRRCCCRPRGSLSQTAALRAERPRHHRGPNRRGGAAPGWSCWEASDRSRAGSAALHLAVAAEPRDFPTTAAIGDAKDRAIAIRLRACSIPPDCAPARKLLHGDGPVTQRRPRSARRRQLEAVQRAPALPRCAGSRVDGRRAGQPARPPVRRRPASGGG